MFTLQSSVTCVSFSTSPLCASLYLQLISTVTVHVHERSAAQLGCISNRRTPRIQVVHMPHPYK